MNLLSRSYNLVSFRESPIMSICELVREHQQAPFRVSAASKRPLSIFLRSPAALLSLLDLVKFLFRYQLASGQDDIPDLEFLEVPLESNPLIHRQVRLL